MERPKLPRVSRALLALRGLEKKLCPGRIERKLMHIQRKMKLASQVIGGKALNLNWATCDLFAFLQ